MENIIADEANILTQLGLGVLLIAITVAFHAFCLDIITRNVALIEWPLRRFAHKAWKSLLVTCIVLATFLVIIIDIWIWAIVYLYLGDSGITNLEEALYYSTCTFTTVGFGDVVLSEQWRLLGSFESACGFIIFGLSTAFIFNVIQPIYRRESSEYESRAE